MFSITLTTLKMKQEEIIKVSNVLSTVMEVQGQLRFLRMIPFFIYRKELELCNRLISHGYKLHFEC